MKPSETAFVLPTTVVVQSCRLPCAELLFDCLSKDFIKKNKIRLEILSISFYLIIFQIIFIVLLGIFGEFYSSLTDDNSNIGNLYPMFMDVHSMMFVGFGFLMTFLKRHGFGGVGYNFLIAAVVIEWAILMRGWIRMIEFGTGNFQLELSHLLEADFCAAAVLISFGAVIGKVTLSQLFIMTIIEVIIQSFNEYICVHFLNSYDIGESMYVHAFGAYFGLGVAKALHNKEIKSEKEGSSYNSDIFAMIGTLFLWLYWPSFNSATAVNDEAKTRAIVNTYLSLAGSCVTTFMISVIVTRGKLNMVHIQNATLAGGVAVGAVADVITRPVGSVIIGSFSGIVSTLGFQYLSPLLKKINIHDTCGVHNLHGVPGIISGIASGIVAAVANRDIFGGNNSTEYSDGGLGRTGVEQGGYQILALVLTLGMSTVGGILTGLLMRIPIFENIKDEKEMFEDEPFWEIEDEFFKSQKYDVTNNNSWMFMPCLLLVLVL
ncbi:Rh type B glyco [Brachionus plicatilis]|uniref:Rh type B glyco n=1 Tax=Brachionus plicatilis TaxID=10195 RepID=A0A3M7RV59_BRAPC|nr:Rh type B glyco [Brachionus plicatilis]